MFSRQIWILLLFTTWVATPITHVVAQPSPERVERARTLFTEGVELGDSGQWEQAVDKFRAALQAHRAPSIEFNLARALLEVGHYPEAHAITHQLLADGMVSRDVREGAIELRDRIRRTSGVVRVNVIAPGQTTVAVDGRELPAVLQGQPIYLPPGTHEITAVRFGATVARRNVEVVRRETVEVELNTQLTPTNTTGSGNPNSTVRIATEQGASTTGTPTAATSTPDDDDVSLVERWEFWVIVGAIAIAGGVTAAVLLSNQNEGEDAPPGTFMPGRLEW